VTAGGSVYRSLRQVDFPTVIDYLFCSISLRSLVMLNVGRWEVRGLVVQGLWLMYISCVFLHVLDLQLHNDGGELR